MIKEVVQQVRPKKTYVSFPPSFDSVERPKGIEKTVPQVAEVVQESTSISTFVEEGEVIYTPPPIILKTQ